ncbi:MAG: hypothetical protein LBI94_01835 [Treponema sp.]|jgi:hypothetical protein|nr:hypothetical protein [Treponema sp.]
MRKVNYFLQNSSELAGLDKISALHPPPPPPHDFRLELFDNFWLSNNFLKKNYSNPHIISQKQPGYCAMPAENFCTFGKIILFCSKYFDGGKNRMEVFK